MGMIEFSEREIDRIVRGAAENKFARGGQANATPASDSTCFCYSYGEIWVKSFSVHM